jgi:hypothetical protein
MAIFSSLQGHKSPRRRSGTHLPATCLLHIPRGYCHMHDRVGSLAPHARPRSIRLPSDDSFLLDTSKLLPRILAYSSWRSSTSIGCFCTIPCTRPTGTGLRLAAKDLDLPCFALQPPKCGRRSPPVPVRVLRYAPSGGALGFEVTRRDTASFTVAATPCVPSTHPKP